MKRIQCKVIENEFCNYGKGEYYITRHTPEGMCSASFVAIWPFANAMLHSKKTGFENEEGAVIITCPDGWVQFKLTRDYSYSPSKHHYNNSV